MNNLQTEKVARNRGFIAALDQSGGSTPKALRDYGIADDSYTTDAEMFDLVHAMRSRIITSQGFNSSRIFGAILFEQTMDRAIEGMGTSEYLWSEKQIVPFLKVDKGLADQTQGVQLMKPIDGFEALLDRAKLHPIFGTKMRSVIHLADTVGIDLLLEQQFSYARTILMAGFVPIIEPEVDINSLEKAAAERILKEGIERRLQDLDAGQQVMLKLSIPSLDGFYTSLASDSRVLRFVALSGGYGRDEACARLARNPGVVASFSRALAEGLTNDLSSETFDKILEHSIEEIYKASTEKSAL